MPKQVKARAAQDPQEERRDVSWPGAITRQLIGNATRR